MTEKYKIVFVENRNFTEFALLINACLNTLASTTSGCNVDFVCMTVEPYEKGQLYIKLEFEGK